MKVIKSWMGRMRHAALGIAAAAAVLSAVPGGLVSEAEARTIVNSKVKRGQIVVKTSQRALYFGLGRGKAIRYRVGVGKPGRQWTGVTRIRAKRLKPAWRPTREIIRDKPGIRRYFPGGSPSNPMGAAALVIGNQYAIHGTNKPGSIGGFVSYGCIRMYNRDVLDLYKRVRWGTKVTVTR